MRSSYQRAFAGGEILFDEGDPGDKLYVIQAGAVELTREGSEGHRLVARLGPGDFFGELGVVLGRPSTTRAVAIEDTRVLELDRGTLEAMCLEEPQIAIRLIRVLVSRLIEAERRLAFLGGGDQLRLVVRVLLRRARSADRESARMPTSLRKLAEEAGLPLLETYRALHHLFERRLVRLVDDVLSAPDLEALSACLDSAD